MAGINNALVHRVPSRIIINPTTVGLAQTPRDETQNYGGTILGNCDRIRLTMGIGAGGITADEFGGDEIDFVLIQKSCVVSFLMEAWDEDSISTIFPNVTTGPSTEDNRVIEIPGSNRSGYLLSGKAVTLLVAADDAEIQPSILIPKAVPLLVFSEEARFSTISILSVPALFQAVRDANNRICAIGKIQNLSNLGWV